MEEADRLADRVAIMDHGRLLALDSPAALKRSIGADTVVKVSADGDLDSAGPPLSSPSPAPGASRWSDGSLQVHVDRAAGVLPRLIAHTEAGGFTVTDLSMTEPTLETVFINLTGKELRE